MKNVFVTSNPHNGKVPSDFSNPRTEFAWAYYLNAEFIRWDRFEEIKGYDNVFCILPKQQVIRDTDGKASIPAEKDPQLAMFYKAVEQLKENNKHIIWIQEGPVWYFQNYSIEDQFWYLQMLPLFDMFLAHDEKSEMWFRGIAPPGIPVHILPSTMIMEGRKDPLPYEDRSGTLVGGNFAWWHGGLNSFLIAKVLEGQGPIEAPRMHTFYEKEGIIDGLNHLEYMALNDWLENFRKYKYAVHMMPVVGAGSFSLNAVYAGVPCIGSHDIPTQKELFPGLSFDPDNLYYAKEAMLALTDPEVWRHTVEQSWDLFLTSLYNPVNWTEYMKEILTEAK